MGENLPVSMFAFRAFACWLLGWLVPLILSNACVAQSNGPSFPTEVRCSGPSRDVTSVHDLQIPEKALQACQKGTQRFAAKDSAGSIAEFQKAIKAFPLYYEAYAKLGAAQLDLDHWDEAETAFRKSIELSGGRYAPADFGVGLILATVKKQFSAAEETVRNGLAMEPNDVTGRFVLAWVLYSTARFQEAERSAREALESAPGFAGAQLLLAQIHLDEHNLSAAIDDMNAYLSSGIVTPLYTKVQQARETALRQLAMQTTGQAIAKSDAHVEGQANLK